MTEVTSVEKIKQAAISLVEIAGFEQGEKITVKLRKTSLMRLARRGKIPNQLLATATELFEGQTGKSDKGKGSFAKKQANAVKMASEKSEEGEIQEFAEILYIFAEEALMEPSFEEIGDLLTDQQLTEIFTWTQGGLAALNSFREEQEDIGLDSSSENMEKEAQRNIRPVR